MLVLSGHNVIITGQCGTGKTHILRTLIKDISSNLKRQVSVTATTGMASMQLGYGATTLHHWAGILDGRYSCEELEELFLNDDKFAAARERIQSTEILIIDEISMLSKKIIEQVEYVCRLLLKEEMVFGGLQVIGCGDFKQLPPVPNYRYGDDGSYCLESNVFQKTFQHHINLTEVKRQNEPELVRAITELCNGTPSEDTVQLLRSLDRPLPENVEITRLYGTNFEINYINHECIEDENGPIFTYKAKNEGPRHLLHQLNVPNTLILKEEAPVMLTRNLVGSLYNGSRGKVHTLKKDCPPVVNFNGKLIEVPLYNFEVYSQEQSKILARRTQYPLILAYALTVHRAQGQTLQYVDVDCHSFFAPGQLGVAIGRCTNIDGLRVENFNLHAASLKHSQCVYDFYSKDTFIEPLDDLSCCRKYVDVTFSCSSLNPGHSGSFDSGSETEEENEDELQDFPQLTIPWTLDDFFKENEGHTFITCLNPEFMLSNELKQHAQYLYFKLSNITKKPLNVSTTPNWNSAYRELNKFITSDSHMRACEQLFRTKDISALQNKLSSKLVFWLMDKLIEQKANEVIDTHGQNVSEEVHAATHTPAGEAKIRYIAGVCLHKVTNKVKCSVERNIGKTTKKSKIARKLNFKKQRMLQFFRIKDEASCCDQSMVEILHKQGVSKGLTIVCNEMFEFI